MRIGTLLVPPLLFAAPALAGPGSAPAKPPTRHLTVEAMNAEIDRAEARLEALTAKAHEDPRTMKVDRYLAYSVEELQAARREVKAADLADFIADKDAPISLRERARDALKSPLHRTNDPDLMITEGRSRRARFCEAKLLPLLTSRDEIARTFAADLLDQYWYFTDPDIQRYNPRPGNERTWAPALAAYRRLLGTK